MNLPKFRYHPDPLSTGSIKASDNKCIVCEQARGYIYTIYTSRSNPRKEYHECICPWCIADGSAHEKLGVKFTDSTFIGGGGLWDDVPQSVIEEVTFRTPGFYTWQGEKWFTHCGDACEFLGKVGYAELLEYSDDAIKAIQNDTGLLDGDEWQDFMKRLDKNGSPVAYLFKCLHCGQYGGYTDCD